MCECPRGGINLEREYDHVEALRLRVVVAARVGDELPADAGRSVDRRRVPIERVEVDGVVHVPRETADDVRARVVREHRRARARGAEDVHHVVHGLHDVAVADAQPLVRRLHGELVAAAGVALLVVIQALEARAELWVRLRLLRRRLKRAAPAAPRERAIDDAVEVGRLRLVLDGRELLAEPAVRRGVSSGRRAGAGEFDLARDAGVRRRGHRCARTDERHEQRDGGEMREESCLQESSLLP